jgi:aldehyde:ferredoxin oxidoreductase
VVIQGKAKRPLYLWITDGKAEFRDASRLWGLDTYETQEALWRAHGREARVLTIGPAGENRSRIGIILTDTGDASGQCGFGGVMGSKNLKAVVVRGTGEIQVAHPDRLMKITHEIQQLFSRKSLGKDPYKPNEIGFKFNIWGGGHGRGGLSMFPGELEKLCDDPSSPYRRAPDGCYACPVSCRSRVTGPDIPSGVALCAQAFMYMESIMANPQKGYNKVTWEAAKLADRYGINAYEIQAIVPWLSDCYSEEILDSEKSGLPLEEIGSRKFIHELIKKIASREGIGDTLSEGGLRAAEAMGEDAFDLMIQYYTRAGRFGGYREHWAYLGGYPNGYAVPHIALIWALDTRDAFTSHEFITILWGGAVTMGQGEVTAVADDIVDVIKPAMNYAYGSEKAAEFITKDGQDLVWDWSPAVTRRYQQRSILKDSYIVCDNLFPFLYSQNTSDHVGDTSLESKLFSAVTGQELSEEASYEAGEKLVNLERAIAARDGRNRTDDVLYDHYYETTDAADRQYKKDSMEKAKDAFYELMGWDVAGGIPTRKRLEQLGYSQIADELEERGLLQKT